MKHTNFNLLLSFAVFLFSGLVMLDRWDDTQKWRHQVTLIAFIIFSFFFVVNLYAYLKGRKRK